VHLTWPQGLLFGCIVASLLFLLSGALRVLDALKKTKAHAESARALIAALDLPSADRNIARMNAAISAMPALAQRAMSAVASMNQSIRDLKLPEAMAALRTAATAVKLLFSGR
jgi:hypothetical protein